MEDSECLSWLEMGVRASEVDGPGKTARWSTVVNRASQC